LSLAGESRNGVILDAENQSQVIVINQSGSVEISNLTITGGNTQNYNYGGGIYCNNASPIIQNVTIQANNGYCGGGMFCSSNSRPKLEDVTIFDNYAEYLGGGIYCEGNTFPVLKNITISTNSANYSGGGLHLSSSTPTLENVTITENSADYGGGIYFYYSFPVFDSINRCNIYLNNASAGNDLYSDYGNISIVLDTFSVLHPTQFFASPLSNFSFDVLNGKIEQVEADLYVSPDGDNVNSGLTTNDPLKTIRFAMIRMLADSLHPHTVHLLDGTYSPSGNGDIFPVYVTDYVKLLGSSSSDVILDAEGLSGVVEMRNNTGSGLSNLTITGGYAEYGGGIYLENSSPIINNVEIVDNHSTATAYGGGGIYCINYSSPLIQNSVINSNQAVECGGGIFCIYDSNPILRNLAITNNSAKYGGGFYSDNSDPVMDKLTITGNSATYGGGVFCGYSSSPAMSDLIISNNTAEDYGGGIFFRSSSPVLENSLLTNNISENAGGIYFENSNPVLIKVTISENTATDKGGGIYTSYSNPVFDTANRCNIYLNLAQTGKDCYSNSFLEIAVDTFTVLHPKTYHASPLSNFSFDILHGMIPQQDVVLYASPEGDDGNSGLSENDPLKTIQHAIEVSNSDSVNLFTIQLKNGIYSPSSTGEVFPLSFVDYGNLIGESEAGTILDAEGQSEVIHLDGSNFGEISNLTISGGHASAKGGGIYSYNSSALLKNLSITGNVTNYQGGGMYCYNSNLVLQNIKISNNEANNGGGIYCDASNPEFENITISGNSATNFGGGIFLNQSNPVMLNTSIINNNSFMGGGIYCSAGTNPVLKNTSVFNNSAETGGGIYLYYSNPVFDTINRSNIYMNFAETGNDLFADFSIAHVVVDTFSVLYPTAIFASPLANFTFDILHGKIEQIEADHYVSPTGDNSNSGLTADEPLKTIRFAMVKILADSLHPHTIRLQEGIYSPSRTNEKFPITLIDYVSLSGISQGDVILDAEKRSRVIQLNNNKGSGISNLTITHGFGGMYCNNSSPVIQNITFFDNKADYGGGLYLENSNPSLTNVALYENQATKGSGIYCYGSNPLMVNTTIVNNLNTNAYGGGIFCGAGSNAKIVNSILWNNSPHEVMLQGVYLPNSVEISYSDVMDGENGIFINGVGTVNWLEGNINEDPIFVGSGNHLYQVSDLSPCIDAGTPDTTGLNLPEYDLAGNPRFVNGRVDIGAYEWNSMFEQDKAITGTIGFEVYPNPVKDFFFVKFSSRPQTTYLFEMYNTCGNIVKSVSGKTSSSENYQLKINTANLQPGLYFIRMQAGNQMATKKVVKL
jgi:predicted outer membrane repeat protein